MVAIVSHKRDAIRQAVQEMYSALAADPGRGFHFPTGRSACRAVGYPDALLAGVPGRAIESFAGVGCPFAADVVRTGDQVLDLGAGSGTDALVCARLTGPAGKVWALDMTPGMRAKLEAVTAEAGVANLEVLSGDAEAIPLPDAAVDVVTTNGVLNLVPDKARAIREIFRVLKPGGRLQISDIALARPVAERFRQDPQMWAECVVGAVEEDRYLAMLERAGFTGVERLGELDYFSLSSSDTTREVAGLFTAHSVTLRATKPGQAAEARPAGPAGRRVAELAGELGAIVMAVVAWMACAGIPALVSAFAAFGVGHYTEHAYLVPAYAAFLGLSVWLLWRSGRARERLGPFWLAFAGTLFAVASTWLAVVGIAPRLGWWSYLGVAAVAVASIWSFVLGREPGACLAEMRYEAHRLQERPLAVRRFTLGAGTMLVAAFVLYGLYYTVDQSVFW